MAAEPHQPFCGLILLDTYFYKLEGENEKCLFKKKRSCNAHQNFPLILNLVLCDQRRLSYRVS